MHYEHIYCIHHHPLSFSIPATVSAAETSVQEPKGAPTNPYYTSLNLTISNNLALGLDVQLLRDAKGRVK